MDVSVVIPTYNRDELLKRAIDSILEQTRQPAEIIVVDDASDVDTQSILRSYYEEEEEIRCIRHETNSGAAKARNTGVHEAESEYIAFLDSDDYWESDKLELQLQVAEQYPDAGIIYCDTYVVDEAGKVSKSGKKLVDEDVFDHLLDGWMAPNPSTLVVRKDAYLDIGGFDPDLSSCSDHDFWMRIAVNDIEVMYVSEPLSYFTRDAENRTSLQTAERMAGVFDFLSNWRGEIISNRGRIHFYAFLAKYVQEAAFPLFLAPLLEGRVVTSMTIWGKYLAVNPYFYAKCFNLVKKLIMS